MVLSHSAELKKSELRSTFWLLLFGSKAMTNEPSQPPEYLKWLVEQSSLFPPRVVFEFGDLNKKQMDAVRQFFLRDDQQQHQQRLSCKFGLSFTDCSLSMACLRLLQHLLDHISTPENFDQRHYSIHSLDLSHNPMRPAQLDLVTEMLSNVYQLREINIADLTWLSPSLVNQTSLLNLTRAAFSGSNESTRLSKPPPTKSTSIGGHRSLSLAENPLDVENFAAMGSSLRYDCVYDEISLASMICSVDEAPKTEEC